MPGGVARVVVDSPLPQLDRLFDYAIPDGLAHEVAPGVRVKVPLRSLGRIADGFVVEVVGHGDFEGTLSDLEAVVSTAAVLAPEVWTLARRVSDRAAGTASDVLRLAVPKRQVRVEKAWLAASATPSATPEPGDEPGDELGAVVAREVTGYPAADADATARLAVTAIPRLVELADGTWVGHWAMTMAAAASHSLADGASAILCVPDHRDQRQLVAALHELLPPESVVQLDARQPNPDRYRAHLACLGDTPLVIVGNRSVVYAPAQNLGLIAIWDDGDPLHAEPLSPAVHSRDAALVRQEQQHCGLWFVGHARSTEVQRLVEIGYLRELDPERAASPRVIPTASQAPQDRFAAMARIPSSAWREARAALDHGPVLVQVARPGFAPGLICTECRQSARCARCEGPLGLRTATAIPSCGWCGALAAEWECSHCGGTKTQSSGHGGTRTADELGRAFPGVRVIVADGEHQVLTVTDAPAIVVSTRGAEPIAAGGYHAVLLLDGERMLARESLRVGEDCLRWWSAAAALAKPGAPVVLVGVGGQLASAMSTWRLPAYAAEELRDRRRLRFPPAVRIATVTGDAAAVERAVAASGAIPGTDVLGPVPVEGPPSLVGATPAVRAIVRFDYAAGAAIATALRGEVIRVASSRRKRVQGTGPRPGPPTLKVRFDDIEPFAE